MLKTNIITFTKSKYFAWLPLIIILILFIIAKASQLTLPHYWDESWSYATAVQKMYEQGPTLLPGKIGVDFTRGHPLFFYAAASSWMKLFGSGLFAKHCFALFISLLLIVSLYIICVRLFNVRVAVMVTLLLCLQIFFFVQSSMFLPEVLVALFALLSIYFYTIKHYWALSLSLSLALLTKESGFVLGITLAISFLLDLRRSSGKEKFKMFVTLLIPALIIISFFIYQKHIYGWYFFPEHLGYIDLTLKDIGNKLFSFLKTVLSGEKRKWYWLILVCLLIYLYIFKKKIISLTQSSEGKKIVRIFLIFCLLYLAFSAINFYTARYLMPVLLISLIILALGIDAVFKFLSLKYYTPLILIILALSMQSFLKNDDKGDIGMGSYQALKVERDLINYLSKHHLQEANIGYGSFQQRVNMQNNACGFIDDSTATFKNVRWDIDTTTQYAVFDNIEEDNRYDSIKQSPDFRLLFSTHHKKIWGEIYRRVHK